MTVFLQGWQFATVESSMAYSHSYIGFHITQTCLVDAYINTAIEQLSDEKTRDIMKTCPCNEHPHTPHFYIEKLGLHG